MEDRKELINCHFCLAKEVVVNVNDYYKCSNCNAEYHLKHIPGKTSIRSIVIQDVAAMHDDSWMGFIIVYPAQGDISKKTALQILATKQENDTKGFSRLSEDFENRLWCNCTNARFEMVAIEEVCKKFAFEFTATTDKEAMTQLVFFHDITSGISERELNKMHELINSIPGRNDNLVRYFVAEAQTQLIVKAAKRAHEKYVKYKNEFGAKMVRAMCV